MQYCSVGNQFSSNRIEICGTSRETQVTEIKCNRNNV